MNALEVLTQARSLIADEKRWTQGVYVRYDDDAAFNEPCAWCATGAVGQVVGAVECAPHYMDGLDNEVAARGALERLYYAAGGTHEAEVLDNETLIEDIAGFNDSKMVTHSDVVALFDEAIADAAE